MLNTKLTQKQLSFVENYLLNGGNGTQAVLGSYKTRNRKSASVIASRNLQNPRIAQALRGSPETERVILDSIARTIKEGLEATIDGKVPDYVIRHMFVTTCIELMNLNPRPEKQVTKSGVLTQEAIDRIRTRDAIRKRS